MEYGVSQSLRQLSNEHPRVDYSFFQERFSVECDTPNDIDDDNN